MIHKPYRHLSKKVIPDGEGFNALPIAFNPYPYLPLKRKATKGNL